MIRVVPGRPGATVPPGTGPHTAPPSFWPPLTTQLLVLQATPFCNIDCSYCYLPDRGNTARMSLATVRLAAQRLREDGLLGSALTVVWHAGEPLVLPPAWYEAAFAAIADALHGPDRPGAPGAPDNCTPPLRITHAFQTNATLVDDAWCRFFVRHGVQIGVSVDGPAHLHDAHRRTRRGGGTHAAVLRGMQALRRHGVLFHAIAVVGAATLAEPDAFYDWFEQQGIAELGCNVDEAEGAHAQSSLAGHDAAHAAFIQRLLQRALRGRVAIRELDGAWQALRAPLPRWGWLDGADGADGADAALHDAPLNTQAMPLALVSVAHDGRFGSFSPELLGQPWPAYDDFVLGNVHSSGYRQALQGANFTRLWHGIAAGIRACAAQCAYFGVCGGGAPANKLYEHGSLAATETLHCRAMVQRPFDAVLRHAEQSLLAVPDASSQMPGHLHRHAQKHAHEHAQEQAA